MNINNLKSGQRHIRELKPSSSQKPYHQEAVLLDQQVPVFIPQILIFPKPLIFQQFSSCHAQNSPYLNSYNCSLNTEKKKGKKETEEKLIIKKNTFSPKITTSEHRVARKNVDRVSKSTLMANYSKWVNFLKKMMVRTESGIQIPSFFGI